MPEAPLKAMNAPQIIETAQFANPLKRALYAGLGVSILLAALGVWVVPVDDGDSAMQLVKLVFSVTMLVLGMVLISALDTRHAEPEIHLDPKTRHLKILAFDKSGATRVIGSYQLDELSDITLRDKHLTARDAQGAQIVSIAVRNPAAEKAIRAALSDIL